MFCVVHVLKLLLFVAILPGLREKQLLRHFSRLILTYPCFPLRCLSLGIGDGYLAVPHACCRQMTGLGSPSGARLYLWYLFFCSPSPVIYEGKNNICLPAYTHGILLSQAPACRCSTDFVTMSPWAIVPH